MPVIDLKNTGKNIKEKMEEKGVTVKYLATVLGFASPNAVYKWIKGETLPTLDNLFIVATILDLKMDDLIVAKKIA